MSAPVPEWISKCVDRLFAAGDVSKLGAAEIIAEAHAKADGWRPIAAQLAKALQEIQAVVVATEMVTCGEKATIGNVSFVLEKRAQALKETSAVLTKWRELQPLPAPPASGKEEA